jgi:hypothetical protein
MFAVSEARILGLRGGPSVARLAQAVTDAPDGLDQPVDPVVGQLSLGRG